MNPRFKSRDTTDNIITYCSGYVTDLTVRDIERRHKLEGYLAVGCHFIILKDGSVEDGRDLRAHAAYDSRFNHNSVVVCLLGLPEEITEAQRSAMHDLISALFEDYPKARWHNHHSPKDQKENRTDEPQNSNTATRL